MLLPSAREAVFSAPVPVPVTVWCPPPGPITVECSADKGLVHCPAHPPAPSIVLHGTAAEVTEAVQRLVFLPPGPGRFLVTVTARHRDAGPALRKSSQIEAVAVQVTGVGRARRTLRSVPVPLGCGVRAPPESTVAVAVTVEGPEGAGGLARALDEPPLPAISCEGAAPAVTAQLRAVLFVAGPTFVGTARLRVTARAGAHPPTDRLVTVDVREALEDGPTPYFVHCSDLRADADFRDCAAVADALLSEDRRRREFDGAYRACEAFGATTAVHRPGFLFPYLPPHGWCRFGLNTIWQRGTGPPAAAGADPGLHETHFVAYHGCSVESAAKILEGMTLLCSSHAPLAPARGTDWQAIFVSRSILYAGLPTYALPFRRGGRWLQAAFQVRVDPRFAAAGGHYVSTVDAGGDRPETDWPQSLTLDPNVPDNVLELWTRRHRDLQLQSLLLKVSDAPPAELYRRLYTLRQSQGLVPVRPHLSLSFPDAPAPGPGAFARVEWQLRRLLQRTAGLGVTRWAVHSAAVGCVACPSGLRMTAEQARRTRQYAKDSAAGVAFTVGDVRYVALGVSNAQVLVLQALREAQAGRKPAETADTPAAPAASHAPAPPLGPGGLPPPPPPPPPPPGGQGVPCALERGAVCVGQLAFLDGHSSGGWCRLLFVDADVTVTVTGHGQPPRDLLAVKLPQDVTSPH